MALIANAPAEERLDQPSIEERRALIERVAASAQFRRSARLRDFLLYVGGQSLKEGCPEIHEQEIGAKVFGRNSSYDRSQDNIVRVNATELRKRIEQYFATEGANEPLILEIPRGAYKPIFNRRIPETLPGVTQPTAPQPLPIPASEPTSTPQNTPGNSSHLLWAILAMALAAICVLLLQQNRAMRRALDPWGGKPTVASFWGDFLSGHQQTDIVLPDDSLMVTEDLFGHPVSLEDYLSRNYMRQIQSSDLSADRKSDLDQLFSHNLVTFGGVKAAQLILAQIPTSSSTPNLTFSRYFGADSIKRDNVILVGGKKANPWVHLFEEQMNFVTDYDNVAGHAFVANRNPKPGELASYPVANNANGLIGYATVAYLPNLSRTGNVIILAGTDSDATGAAAEFLTSEDQLE